jgi:hypothetical protein
MTDPKLPELPYAVARALELLDAAGQNEAADALEAYARAAVEQATPEKEDGPGSNTGHGHVWPRPDGGRARCGGPGLCKPCAADAARYPPKPAAVELAGGGEGWGEVGLVDSARKRRGADARWR